jgi:hypothetical protein
LEDVEKLVVVGEFAAKSDVEGSERNTLDLPELKALLEKGSLYGANVKINKSVNKGEFVIDVNFMPRSWLYLWKSHKWQATQSHHFVVSAYLPMNSNLPSESSTLHPGVSVRLGTFHSPEFTILCMRRNNGKPAFNPASVHHEGIVSSGNEETSASRENRKKRIMEVREGTRRKVSVTMDEEQVMKAARKPATGALYDEMIIVSERDTLDNYKDSKAVIGKKEAMDCMLLLPGRADSEAGDLLMWSSKLYRQKSEHPTYT